MSATRDPCRVDSKIARKNLANNADRCSPRQPRRSWESRFGCCAAVSLTILEVKRLLLLALEMLVDSRPIRFAGALMPLIFSFVDVGIGFPVACVALYVIRKQQKRPCYPKMKRMLRRVALLLMICVILNTVTIGLIGYQIKLGTDSLIDLFRASMKYYATKASYKIAIDELQLDLQCCGFASFADWFAFDWQGSDYLDAENVRFVYVDIEQSVPYSCCNRRAMTPCVHNGMRQEDVKSINGRGCAAIVSGILFKITVVGYVMTSLIVVTQILMIVCVIRIIRRIFPELCPSECLCCQPTCPMTGTVFNNSSDDCASPLLKKPCGPRQKSAATPRPPKICRRPRATRKICGGGDSSTTSKCTSARSPRNNNNNTSWSSDSLTSSPSSRLTSSPSFSPPRRVESASIVPSAHLQHQVPAMQRRNK